MRRPVFSLRRLFAVAMIGLAILGCNLHFNLGSTATASLVPPASETRQSEPTATSQLASETPSVEVSTETPTPSPTSSGTPEVVSVKATGGKLNVRRGPGPEYNFVGAFLNGQSATATARNADASWLYISVPNSTRGFGWITVKTQYTVLTGNASTLPLSEVPPAVPAYIRNCTAHEMLVSPADVVLPDRGNAPENKVQFYPGEYTVSDQTTEIDVANITVLEGVTIDIKKDSSGKSYSCP